MMALVARPYMRRLRTLSVFLGVVLLARGLGAQLPEPEISPELMRLIRKEKFDVILPQVMRDNQIDMWIYAKGADDSLDFELSEDAGIYIFTDRGGDRIERALFGGRGDETLYDIFGARTEVASVCRSARSKTDRLERLGARTPATTPSRIRIAPRCSRPSVRRMAIGSCRPIV